MWPGCMPQPCHLYQNNGVAPTITSEFPVSFLMPLLWQSHSSTAFFFVNQLSDLSHAAVSKDTLIQFKKIKKEATMVISVSWRLNTDLALAALFMFLTLKSLFGYIFFCIFWVEISCNLSNLSGPRLYWQKKGKVCVAWSENSLSIFAQME